MVDEKNKPSSTDPSAEDVTSEGGEEDVKSSPDVGEKLDAEEQQAIEEGEKEILQNLSIEELNRFTGRQFKDKEDFLKHYKNLNSLIGKKALAEPIPEDKFVTKEELALLDKYPEAKPYLQQLEKLKGANESLTQTYETQLKDIIEKARAYEKSKEEEKTQGIEPSSKIPSEKVEKVAEITQALKNPSKDNKWGQNKSDLETILVEEALGENL